MTSNIFQDIKDRVDLKDLVRYYGLKLDRGGFACCQFHNRGYAEYYLETLLIGSRQEQRELYEMDKSYPEKIKKRLDSLDSVSRSAYKKAI